jgi:hypothetical protein
MTNLHRSKQEAKKLLRLVRFGDPAAVEQIAAAVKASVAVMSVGNTGVTESRSIRQKSATDGNRKSAVTPKNSVTCSDVPQTAAT